MPMLDRVDLKRSLKKSAYQAQIEPLTLRLRSLQQECRDANLPVVVVLEGWAAAGKGKIVQHMLQHIDPRGFIVHPILAPTPRERRYPWLWRFWQTLPGRGQMGIYYHSWYTHLLEDRLFQRISDTQFPAIAQEVIDFEKALVDDGAIVTKFFIHMGLKELTKRLKAYEDDPFEAWRVRPEDWQQAKNYEEYQAIADTTLDKTHTADVPWTLVAGDDKRWARIQVLTTMVEVLSQALARRATPSHAPSAPSSPQPASPDRLAQVDLSARLERDRYKTELGKYQLRLHNLQTALHQNNRAALILFEGWDAAGKGGAIRRLTTSLDPRNYQVHPFAAPTDEAKAHHYLWRFWKCLPPKGTLAVFDRTWYGRVLVERVENFATTAEWSRAYGEINALEAQLTRSHTIVVKFWLHIDPEEQLRRFRDRQENPFKQHKITDEDWRNREKWDDYYQAVNDMLHHTSTDTAPWTLVAANDKLHARIQVLKTVIKAIEKDL